MVGVWDMKKTRKTVIVITSVLAVTGIFSAVTGAIVKKNTSAAKYMDGYCECL